MSITTRANGSSLSDFIVGTRRTYPSRRERWHLVEGIDEPKTRSGRGAPSRTAGLAMHVRTRATRRLSGPAGRTRGHRGNGRPHSCVKQPETTLTNSRGNRQQGARTQSSGRLDDYYFHFILISTILVNVIFFSLSSGLYCAAAKCYDKLDNIESARRCLVAAVQIDPACVEAADLLAQQSHLGVAQRQQLLGSIDFKGREWIAPYYK